MTLADDFAVLAAHYAAARARLAGGADLFARPVRGWAAGGHLWHTERAAQSVLRVLGRLAAGEGAGEAPSARVRAFLATGVFPRGIEAPGRYHPPDDVDAAAVRALLDPNAAAFAALAAAADALGRLRGTLAHPVVGPMDAPLWVRFAAVHAAHHDALIADLLAG